MRGISKWWVLAPVLCAAAMPLTWKVGIAVLNPGGADAFDSVAVKDPSVVRYGDKWHVFYTARDKSDYTLGYVSAGRWEDLDRAPRHALTQLKSARSKYAAAPQVFYFRPQRKWYLIFQTTDSNYLPVYSTSADVGDFAAWTPAQTLLEKKELAKWIDFWVICDDRQAYLYFTREHRDVMVMTTKLEDFPRGFGNPQVAFAPVHEAVHVYSLAGSYAMIYEQQRGDVRHFGLARAETAAGPWKVANEQFAGGGQLSYGAGQPRWTEEVSHGELLRAGFDERMEAPAGEWELLIQGLARGRHQGEYPLLPWRLGLIRAPAPF